MIALLLASLALPCWMLLLLAMPLLAVLAQLDIVEPIASIGTIAINAHDAVTALVVLRTVAYVMLSRRLIRFPGAFFAFVLVMLLSTATVAAGSGLRAVAEQSPALLRFIAQASMLVLFSYSLRTVRQLDTTCRLWRLLGYVVAGSVYLDMVLFSCALPVGEVQATADGVRYFGPLGDQVGFLLPFFIYRELLGRRLVGAAFCVVALLVTGTRGALISLAVGLVAFAWPYRHRASWRRNAIVAGAFVGGMGFALWFDPGGMVTRFVNPYAFATGLRSRTSSIDTALRVFLDHPLLGVGFGGFRSSLSHYYSSENVYATFNQLVQVATDAGIVGVGVFVWMIVSLLRLLAEARERVTGAPQELLHAAYIWLVGLAIGNQSTAWLLPGSMIASVLWLLVGTACVAARLQAVQAHQAAEVPLPAGRDPLPVRTSLVGPAAC